MRGEVTSNYVSDEAWDAIVALDELLDNQPPDQERQMTRRANESAALTAVPTPKVVREVCSLCGLDWALHGVAPTTETCIGLLLAEVRSLNAQLAHRPLYPVIPYRPLPVQPWRPYWGTGTTWNAASAGQWSVTPVDGVNAPRAMLSAG